MNLRFHSVAGIIGSPINVGTRPHGDGQAVLIQSKLLKRFGKRRVSTPQSRVTRKAHRNYFPDRCDYQIGPRTVNVTVELYKAEYGVW